MSPPTTLAPLLPTEPPAASKPIWLITFTDLVGLLLAFFVMIFAMSSIDQNRYRDLTGAADLGREPVPGATGATVEEKLNAPQPETHQGADLGYLGALLRAQLGRAPLLAQATVRQDGARVVISLPADLLFAPNGAEPTQAGAKALFSLVGMLRNLPNRIEVEGHADPKPPTAGGFISNWELSLARAIAVAIRLEAAGDRHAVIARGRGDSRYDEIASTLSPAARDALARRVDIIVHEEANWPSIP